MTTTTNDTSVTGTPRTLLRLEGLAMLVAGIVAYQLQGASWGLFALLFLVPDVTLLGYLANPRIGASVYNAGHSLLGPALLAPFAPALAAIWLAHVGFDRALGYGLKYSSAFTATHLGRIGHVVRTNSSISSTGAVPAAPAAT
jgi:hypothetical protein